ASVLKRGMTLHSADAPSSMPVWIARATSSSVQLPRPVAGSGVRFAAYAPDLPIGDSDPERSAPWHDAHARDATRALPVLTLESAGGPESKQPATASDSTNG